MLRKLVNDESGVIISAEIILVLTIAVLGLVAGLGELTAAINLELDDVGNAFGALNQSYRTVEFGRNGFGPSGEKPKGWVAGSAWTDSVDDCDRSTSCDILTPAPTAGEAG